jgi:hypothetical protein
MNSNANTVELRRGLNICLADGRQPNNCRRRKMCIHKMDSITHTYTKEKCVTDPFLLVHYLYR